MATDIESGQPVKPTVVIIKRPRKGGHGHHGGAWKVAYADFVTAMMALFIVLWLMGADDDMKKAVSSYFNNPSGPGKLTGTAAAGQGNSLQLEKQDMAKLKEKIQQAFMKAPNFQNLKDHVEITLTSDGLRIELSENEVGMFFPSGKAAPNDEGEELLERLAQQLGGLPNKVFIEGHTDSKPYPGEAYSNWELSVDRANAARKLMMTQGLKPGQVTQVRGYADTQLRHPDDPMNPSNRRISVIVQYLAGAEAKAADQAEKEKAKADEKEAAKAEKAAKSGKPEGGASSKGAEKPAAKAPEQPAKDAKSK
ncbi:MAG TPA: flagellar motor protein MotB [Bryobacteraceae bacterium]|jgi:chemotaxis protein MotB|nr:flagellar motor protein MotB [Bryobacteraceae bacterium]